MRSFVEEMFNCVKVKMCMWGATRLSTLVILVSNDKLSVLEARVESIGILVRPVKVKQQRSFLGTVGF